MIKQICLLLNCGIAIFIAIGGHSISVKAADADAHFGTVPPKLGPSSHNPPEKDLLLSLSPSNEIEGTLIYGRKTYLTPEAIKAQSAKGYSGTTTLVLYSIKNGQKTITNYPVNLSADDYIMGVNFLPDGRRVLLKLGWPYDRYGVINFYLFDIEKKTLKRFNKTPVTFPHVEVSPNGRYLAFIRGGGRFGYASPNYHNILFIADNETGQEREILINDSITAGGFVWTPQNTLLYSVLPELTASETKISKADNTKKLTPDSKPNLYEISPTGGQPKLVMHDAWRPQLSPDGRRIAFFGSEDLSQPEPLGAHWENNPTGASLSVMLCDGSERKALNREQGNYPALLWMTDSLHLVVTKTLSRSNNPAERMAQIRSFNIQSGQIKTLAQIGAKDAQALPRSLNVMPPFIPTGVSDDGRYLFTQIEQWGEQDAETKIYDRYNTLLAIDLQTNKWIEICKLKNAFGLDWH